MSPPDTPTAAARSNDATAVGIRTNHNLTGGLHGELSEFNEDGVLMSGSAAKMTTVDVEIPIIEDREEHSPLAEPTSHLISNQDGNKVTIIRDRSDYPDSSIHDDDNI